MNADVSADVAVQAERALLGSILNAPDALGTAIAAVNVNSFIEPRHAKLFDLMVRWDAQARPVDPISIANGILSEDLNLIGGIAYLHELTQVPATHINTAKYSALVAEQCRLRRLAAAGNEITLAARRAGEGGSAAALAAASAILDDLLLEAQQQDTSLLSEAVEPALTEIEELAAFRHAGKLLGVPTGFHELDQLLGGLRAGQLIVLAARPAVGKSTLAMDIIRHASIVQRIPSLLFSLEMSQQELVYRIMSAEFRVKLRSIRQGEMNEEDWGKVAARLERLMDAPIWINDKTDITMPEIRAAARHQAARAGVGLIVVDYLQLMSSGTGKRYDSREREVADISRSLKVLAKDLKVPVIAVAQLNRGSESRADKTPVASDLRESGALEQDSDVVLLLHSPDQSAAGSISDRPGETDVIVAKNRAGATGRVTVVAQHEYSRHQNFGGLDGTSSPIITSPAMR